MPTLRHFRFAVAVFIAAFAPLVVRAASPVTLRSAEVAAQLRSEYELLATKYAETVPDWRPKAPATGMMLFIAPDEYTPAGNHRELYRQARNKYADALFGLAQRAAAAGHASLAYQWATETVRENPDHAEARRVLGYEQRDGQWLTAYGAKMLDAGKTWNAQYGWIDTADLARYEAGERLVGDRWLAAEQAARHATDRRKWQIRTDHFLVSTSDDTAAPELAARLERLYQVWRQLFADFYLQPRQVEQLFSGVRTVRPRNRPFRVYYHRDKDDYVAALLRRQPRIADTLGIYFDRNREAHFFADRDQDTGTLYHEAVHQLFQESRPAADKVGDRGNFWIVEGIAAYFETLTEHNDPDTGLYYTIGEASAGRLPAARERLLEDGYYVALEELCPLGKNAMQPRDDLARLYSQATGLAAFLMQADGGRYQGPLIEYLQAVYAGRDSVNTLPRAVGGSHQELDVAYRRYLESLP